MEPLSRWPHRTSLLQGADPSPRWQLWLSSLVDFVNRLLTSVDTNTAAIVLLQPTYGSWTPTDSSGAALTFAVPTFSSFYIKIGQLVYVSCDVIYPVTANGSPAVIGGLPFTNQAAQSAIPLAYTDYGAGFFLFARQSATVLDIYTLAGVPMTNANLSGKTFRASGVYRAAA